MLKKNVDCVIRVKKLFYKREVFIFGERLWSK